jgi:hypothetical protein
MQKKLIPLAHRFESFLIQDVTIENYQELLPVSLALQVESFMPPEGSFDDGCLRRYLKVIKDYEEEDINSNMTLANRLRIAFSDMVPDTICSKFPAAELTLKRRLRCVAEYLIRSGEFDKLRDDSGKLLKKRGILGKLVVIYKPLPKMQEVLQKQGLIFNESP